MFSNALFHPSNTPSNSPRRYSQFGVSIAPKVSQRRATMPVIEVAGMSPGLGYMMGRRNDTGPSTPCFVTPTLGAFSGRRFSFDSPLQTLTAMSSAGLPTINRKAAKRAWAKISTKKWTRPFKILMILLLVSFAATLFLIRKSREISVPVPMQYGEDASCDEGTGMCGEAWVAHNHENKPKEEFMELVSPTEHFHIPEEPSDLWVNRWAVSDTEDMTGSNKNTELESSATQKESGVNVVEQESLGLDKLPSKIIDYVESVKTFIGETISGSDENQEQVEISHDENQEQVKLAESNESEDVSMAIENPPSEVGDKITIPDLEILQMEEVTQVPQAKMVPELQHSQPDAHTPPPGHLMDTRSGVPSNVYQPPPPPQPPRGQGFAPQQQLYHQQAGMSGMPPQPSGLQRPQDNGFHDPPMPQQHHAQGMHHSQGMPQPRHGAPPGVNPARYNQHYQQPQIHHNQGYIGHSPPPPHGYQNTRDHQNNHGYQNHHGYQNNGGHQNNHGQQNNHGHRLPPGVNPHRYGGL